MRILLAILITLVSIQAYAWNRGPWVAGAVAGAPEVPTTLAVTLSDSDVYNPVCSSFTWTQPSGTDPGSFNIYGDNGSGAATARKYKLLATDTTGTTDRSISNALCATVLKYFLRWEGSMHFFLDACENVDGATNCSATSAQMGTPVTFTSP